VNAAGNFRVTGAAYDDFMGRYSRPLAPSFADSAGVAAGQQTLDLGCGPGALTEVLAERLGAAQVSACDPSPPFVAECARRCPGVDVRAGKAEGIPFGEDSFDRVLAQLVLHFVGDPGAAAREVLRVLRPGGVAAACVWDFADGMEMLRLFWDAALAVEPGAPDEARTLRFGRERELPDLFEGAGFVDVVEGTLTVASAYAGFDDLWAGFLQGVGPAGGWLLGLDEARRAAVRAELFERAGRPDGGFTLSAVARYATGRAPG
jgi:SAM-dependent methyltransferase